MLSLRCRINANVAELLVIIGYSESSDLRSELVRSLSLSRPLARSLARPPACLSVCPPPARPALRPLPETPAPLAWFHPGLARLACLVFPQAASLPRGSHWRASRWTAPIRCLVRLATRAPDFIEPRCWDWCSRFGIPGSPGSAFSVSNESQRAATLSRCCDLRFARFAFPLDERGPSVRGKNFWELK